MCFTLARNSSQAKETHLNYHPQFLCTLITINTRVLSDSLCEFKSTGFPCQSAKTRIKLLSKQTKINIPLTSNQKVIQ